MLEMDAEEKAAIALHNAAMLLRRTVGRYHPLAYSDFDDYAQKLPEQLVSFSPDVVVLAVAVSDYAPVKKAEGKISSDVPTLTIELKQTPKLIRLVRQIRPDCFLVGFKLLVGSTQAQLEDAMADQVHKAKVDMCVGTS